MFYGSFSWTRYSYRGDLTKMTADQFHALRALDGNQFPQILQQISSSRWQVFRDEHRWLLWVTGVACISLLLAFVVPFFGIIAFFGWVCALSLAFSAVSQALALNRERRFLTRAYHRARHCSIFEEFSGRDDASTVQLFKAGSFPILERIRYFAPPPYPMPDSLKDLDSTVAETLGAERMARVRTLMQSEPYDVRLTSHLPVPPTKIDALICDLWAVATNDAGSTVTVPQELTFKDLRRAITIYETMPWKSMRGFRPWTHWNFIGRLTQEQREALAVEAHTYMVTVGIRSGS